MKFKLPNSVLFAVYPVLFLFSHNIHELGYSVIWRPLMVVVASTLAFLFFLRLVLNDVVKREIVASLFILLFFSYGHVSSLTKPSQLHALFSSFGLASREFFLVAGAVFFLLIVAWIMKTRRDLTAFSRYMRNFALILVLIPVLNILFFELTEQRDLLGAIHPPQNQSLSELTGTRPDIYYIILDAYAREDVLDRVYGYNNSWFLDYLEGKGFHVASNSRANYPRTWLSLASSLNMQYLDDVAERVGAGSRNYHPLFQLVDDNQVARFLRSKGYTYVFFNSGIQIESPSADLVVDHEKYLVYVDGQFYEKKYLSSYLDLNIFEIMLIQKTPLRILGSYEPLDPFLSHRNSILFYLNQLALIPEMKEPTFVFAHIMSPHPPFVFGPDGEFVENTGEFSEGDADDYIGSREGYINGYRNQVNYLNRLVEETIDRILSESSEPPIIIIQADHGPASTLTVRTLADTDLNERMSILNAYYLPYGGDAELYDSITPVNSFRLVFNQYFNASLDLLEDDVYFSPLEQPYNFVRVS
ncbi:MAG: sulfatase-like hydrolase/transferase [Candidatus Altiarchaeota archaeon]